MINLQLVPQCGNELHSGIVQKGFYGCESHNIIVNYEL